MTDAYYPELDPALMLSGARVVCDNRTAFPERQLTPAETIAYRERAAAHGVRFTDHDNTEAGRDAARANHCRQARAGYFYCASTRDDPCGYSPANTHPHDSCTDGECSATAAPAS